MLKPSQEKPWTSYRKESVDLYELVRDGERPRIEKVNTVPRKDQYRLMFEKGLYRLSVHCWGVGKWNNGSIVLQQRGKGDYRYPGLLDISASGIMDAGENHAQGAVREITEELHVAIGENNLIKSGMGWESGMVKEDVSGLMPGQIPNLMLNEIVAIYFLKMDDLPVLPLQSDGEVMALYSVGIADGIKLFTAQGGRIATAPKLNVVGGFYRPADEGLEEVSIGQIVPRHMKHYLRIFRMAEELIRKDVQPELAPVRV
jgi:8-oxo-dGTP pyrophosphatase MutT (NUDIX family)